MDIQAKVFDIVAEVLRIRREKITFSSKFKEDLGADSLDLIELEIAIENEFDIKIPDEDAELMLLIGDVVQYIKSKKGVK